MKTRDQDLMINLLFVTKSSHRLIAGRLSHTYLGTLRLVLAIKAGETVHTETPPSALTTAAHFFWY